MEAERKRRRSEVFRDAHRELLQLVDAMSGRLRSAELERDPSEVRAMLSMLAGKLTIHLAMEDQALYPRLATHRSQPVREIAERFAQEMGGILAVFREYMARWSTTDAIQADVAGFMRETNQIFHALRARIAKEDGELFPKLDEL